MIRTRGLFPFLLAACARQPPSSVTLPAVAEARSPEQAHPPRTMIFRHVIAGALPSPNRRVTWTLRFAHDATTLERLAEVAPDASGEGHRVDQRFATVAFEPKSRDVFRGAPVVQPFERGSLRLAAPNEALELHCATARVAAREPTAWLDATSRPAHWTGTLRDVSVLRCKDATLTRGDAFEERRGDGADALDFADAPGVEWVFENSDMLAQDGTYRLLP